MKNTKQSRETDNIGYTKYWRKTNKTKIQQREILVTLDTQDTGGRQTKKLHHREILATIDTQDTGGR